MRASYWISPDATAWRSPGAQLPPTCKDGRNGRNGDGAHFHGLSRPAGRPAAFGLGRGLGREERRAPAHGRDAARARRARDHAACRGSPTRARWCACSRRSARRSSGTTRRCRIDTSTCSSVEAPYELVRTMRASSLRARPAARALRPRPRLAAGRLRLGPASGRPAPRRAGGARRHDRDRPRLHRRHRAGRRRHDPGQLAPRHALSLPDLERRCDRQPDHGRRARARHHGGRERRDRARHHGAGRISGPDGREHRGHRHDAPRDRRRRRARARPRRVIPDRIEAATFLVGGAITLGDVTITRCEPGHLAASLGALEEMGSRITINGRRDHAPIGRPPARRERHDRGLPGLPDRHAGADDGAARRSPTARA